MPVLRNDDMILVQSFVESAKSHFAGLGLTVTIDGDLRNWARFMAGAPDPLGVSGALDPEKNDLRPGNSFWIGLRDEAGDIVACHAHRVFRTPDFINELRTYRHFDSSCPTLDWRPLSFRLSDDVPQIEGFVGYGGGLWVHPERRGHAISGVLTRLTRNLSLRHFGIDWYVSFLVDTPARHKLGRFVFGLRNRTPLLTGYYPSRGKDLDVQMFYMRWDEMLRQISDETSQTSSVGRAESVFRNEMIVTA